MKFDYGCNSDEFRVDFTRKMFLKWNRSWNYNPLRPSFGFSYTNNFIFHINEQKRKRKTRRVTYINKNFKTEIN